MPKLLADGRRGTSGRRLVALFVTTWDEEGRRNPILTLLRRGLDRARSGATPGGVRRALRLFAPLLDRLRVDQPTLEGRSGVRAAHRPWHGTLRAPLRGAAGLGDVR